MRYFVKYITHLLTATNQHGVHSPFVYDYVTKCLYSKEKRSKTKSENILLKSIAYFKVQTLFVLSSKDGIEKTILQEFPKVHMGTPPYDLIYLEASDLKSLEKLVLEKKIHNNTVTLIGGIHKTPATELLWNKLKNNKEVTVTIDLFYCGLAFFRKEQVKEHFKIRI